MLRPEIARVQRRRPLTVVGVVIQSPAEAVAQSVKLGAEDLHGDVAGRSTENTQNVTDERGLVHVSKNKNVWFRFLHGG